MINGGLVSITFRQLSPTEIIKLVRQAGLQVIEWGGDGHVPHGDTSRATEVYRMTVDNGLRVGAYGSYYRVNESESAGLSFSAVLDAAQALQAPLIRVWAGKRGSAQADDAYWQAVVDDSHRIVEMASAANIQVAYEYHLNTLTDTVQATNELMQRTANFDVGFYWQPTKGWPIDTCLNALNAVLPRLVMLHVYQWQLVKGNTDRRPLAEGEESWLRYLALAAQAHDHLDAMLEFVQDDSPEQFLTDARTLTHWLEIINAKESL